MVVPVINREGDLLGVLDVDSDLPAAFTDAGSSLGQAECAAASRSIRLWCCLAIWAMCLLTVHPLQDADKDGLQRVCLLLETFVR